MRAAALCLLTSTLAWGQANVAIPSGVSESGGSDAPALTRVGDHFPADISPSAGARSRV